MLQASLLSLSLCGLLFQAPMSEAEVFGEQSTFFARAGAAKGLKVGQEVWVIEGETGKFLGSALVMEVWESMVRLSLDIASSSVVGAKRIRFSRGMEEGLCGRPISGKARLFGAGAFQKLLLSNESEEDWSRCHLLLPTNRVAQLERVAARSTAEIFLSKFRSLGSLQIAPLEYVVVECLEGKARLSMEP